ncbi:MAG: SDR family oxidoreductase, partial [Verrucomicrobiota bacterium]
IIGVDVNPNKFPLAKSLGATECVNPKGAAKAGMLGLTKSMAREVASRGITVNAVAPGFIETDMTGKLDEEITEAAKKLVPLKRFGTVAEIASIVTYLASEEAGYVTGQTFTVDGGMAM